MKLNAEELAAKRFPQVEGEPLPLVQRAYYAEGITEVAQPLQDRVEELEAALKDIEGLMTSMQPMGYFTNHEWSRRLETARAILAKHA